MREANVPTAGPTNGDRLYELTRRTWVKIVLASLLLGTLTRLMLSGVLPNVGMPGNVTNIGAMLFGFLVDHRPMAPTDLGVRTYGVVAFLLYDPAARMFGRDASRINLWGLGISVIALTLAFTLVAMRLNVRRPWSLAALAILWSGFLPIVYGVAMRMFDVTVLATLAATFFFYAGPPLGRRWSGVAAAVGSLTKFLPLIFVPVLFIRDRRAFIYSLVTFAMLLLVGQIVYGPALGFGYPYYVGVPTAAAVDDPTAFISTWHENISPRALLFKVAGGFHLGNTNVTSENIPALSFVANIISLAALGYLLYVLWRYRHADGFARRPIEFALGAATIFMVAPLISEEHLSFMIIVYTILAWYWLRQHEPPAWPLVATAGASLLLTGVYVPTEAVNRVLQLDAIMGALGNQHSAIYQSPIGQYDFLGFPAYGAILAWIVVVILERRTRAAGAATISNA